MSAKPRIAIIGDFPVGLVNDEYKDIKSCNSKWLHTLYLILQEVDEYEFHWVMVDKLYKQENHFEINGHFFHVYPGARLTIGLYTAYIYDRWQIRKCIKKIKPAIVHGWGTERCYGLATKDFKGKRLLSAQGILIAYMQRARISDFECKQSRYERKVYQSMDLVTAESPWGIERLKEIAPNARLKLWEYAADISFLNTCRSLTDFPSCLMAGTASPVKNVELAIRAFSTPELSHVKLYIAGNEALKTRNLPGNIVPLGVISREEIKYYLSKVWALVHPSLADTCPNIVKEARVIGVPAVITSDCGASQYVEHEKSGYVTEPNNEAQFIKGVLFITQNKEKSTMMGSHNIQQCRKALAIDTMKCGIMGIYDSLLKV